jgi:tripartite-type tricarboxylate transporter receptor subunit TctC
MLPQSNRVLLSVLCLLLAAAGLDCNAQAPAYPSKPVRIIVTFSPGGGTDAISRAIAQKLTETWGQSVIVDNRAGGNGNIGADLVAKALADGYTILITTNATIVINPHLTKLPYDPIKDLAPVTQLATLPFVLLAHPSVPVKTVADVIALAKAKPGQLAFGSSGSGGGAHLSVELMKTMAKVDVTHVPYKGSNPALIALVGGEIQCMFVSIFTAMPLIESNRVRAIAVTSPARSPALPNIPAVAEAQGLQGFETDLWYGMLAPAKTPPNIIEMIYRETKRILSLREFHDRFETAGTVLVGTSPLEFSRTIKTDFAKWAPVIKASGAKLD